MKNLLIRSTKLFGAFILCTLTLAGCGGGNNDFASPSYSVGGSVNGFNSSSALQLTLNGTTDTATLSQNGTFQFSNPLPFNSIYAVTATQQPTLQTCTVSNGSGTIRASNITNVAVSCLTNFPIVTTLAGSGLPGPYNGGFANGTGTSARFNLPLGVAVDSSGNAYVADGLNNLIRKITPAGVVSTFAGSGSRGSTNGTGTAASFAFPTDIALDSSGNFYVADTGNWLIRKITADGVVTTLAGSSIGSIDGLGTAARFHNPQKIAVDSSGNIYVAERNRFTIRKITPEGLVTTFAGSGTRGSSDGTGASASFYFPMGLAVDSSGNVYVADEANNLIRKITLAGVVSTFAGSGSRGSTNGTGTAASFNGPIGIALDSSGNVYILDNGNHLIRKITSAGVVSTLAGTGSQGSENGEGTAASFNGPIGISVDSTGNVYVADTYNHLIRKIITK
jgi:sugar lactone lactonase YvrE